MSSADSFTSTSGQPPDVTLDFGARQAETPCAACVTRCGWRVNPRRPEALQDGGHYLRRLGRPAVIEAVEARGLRPSRSATFSDTASCSGR